MATIDGDLFSANFAQVRIVDVSDDYLWLQPPLPSHFYPVLDERWVTRHRLADRLPSDPLVDGYLYDWHESPDDEGGLWYVGVARSEMSVAAN